MNAEPDKVTKILIVDDDESVRDVCGAALSDAGFETSCATTCAEALTAMERLPADVLLLDVELPDGSGLSFLPKFKKLYPAVPVIILTGLGYEEDLMQSALKDGARGFLSKGVAVENMVSTIRNILR